MTIKIETDKIIFKNYQIEIYDDRTDHFEMYGVGAPNQNNLDGGLKITKISGSPPPTDSASFYANRIYNHTYQGSVAGFSYGGYNGPSSIPANNDIRRFVFAQDSDAVIIPDTEAIRSRAQATGVSSETHGHNIGGVVGSLSSPGNRSRGMYKFAFSSGTNVQGFPIFASSGSPSERSYGGAHSSPSYGYVSGGSGPTAYYNTIQYFPFAMETNSMSTLGNLTATEPLSASSQTNFHASCSSLEHGYVAGGFWPGAGNPDPATNVLNGITRFPFNTNTNSQNLGDLTARKFRCSGTSSDTHGYVHGGECPPLSIFGLNVIERFPFSSTSSGSDVGDLSTPQISPQSSGFSSLYYGYTTSNLDKFSFSSSSNAASSGSMGATYFSTFQD